MTTEKTLTNEQIARVFAMYWGQKILLSDIKEVHTIDELLMRSFYVTGESFKSEYKLLPSPLSAITDEDAVGVAKIEGLVNGTVERWHDRIEVIDDTYILYIFFDGRIQLSKNRVLIPVEKYDLLFQYLIQKGYAVPLFIEVGHPDNGKTAIELGLAIDKTKY